jgi:hypothetical protein
LRSGGARVRSPGREPSADKNAHTQLPMDMLQVMLLFAVCAAGAMAVMGLR